MASYQTKYPYQNVEDSENVVQEMEMSDFGDVSYGSVQYHDVDPYRKSKRVFGLGLLACFFVVAFSSLAITNTTNSGSDQTQTQQQGQGQSHLFGAHNNNNPTLSAGAAVGAANFDADGRYVMTQFDVRKPVSDFLNGLGGLWGVPMWAFYVNRGQAIASFGTKNKDGAIFKFTTVEKSYQEIPFTGFRTFIKGARSGGPPSSYSPSASAFTHMPFFPATAEEKEKKGISRDLKIGANEMVIEESAAVYGLNTEVVYFTAPDEDLPLFVRSVTFTNTDSSSDLDIEVLDGLAKLIPAGLSNFVLDAMGRTMEAFMNVYNVGENPITEPFYHISQDPGDNAQVKLVNDGNFAVAFLENGAGESIEMDGLHGKLPFIVDPSVVFGTDTTLTDPSGFFGDSAPGLSDLVKQTQGTTSRTPCAFAGAKVKIPAGKSVTLTSIYGHAKNLKKFLEIDSPKVRKPGFVTEKRAGANALVKEITNKVGTETSMPIFDAYVRQDFLDNVLRGGVPIPLGDMESPKIFHTFSRIHGDLERDYNNFDIDTTFFSQGPGNFRDVCQNRRLDVFHTPVVQDFNVHMFLSFVQADGYNPLTVASTNFRVSDEKKLATLVEALGIVDNTADGSGEEVVRKLLQTPFRPGQFFADAATNKVGFSIDRTMVLQLITAAAEQVSAAQFNQNAFWADHWTYTMDLLKDFLSIYPDKEETLLWEGKPVPFYMSPATVKPRSERYTLVKPSEEATTKTIRVYSAITTWDTMGTDRQGEMTQIYKSPSYVADVWGAGGVWQLTPKKEVFHVTPITKLAMLGIIKFSTLDPEGMGVEMEGGKPGWNDAMNGLPGIVGSGMPETYEMLIILQYVKASVDKYGRGIEFPEEFAQFLADLDSALDKYADSPKDTKAKFEFWDASNTAREAYRKSVRLNFSGTKQLISATEISALLGEMIDKCQEGINGALATTNGVLSPTYFHYECTGYEQSLAKDGTSRVVSKSFDQKRLPLFLEGPTRHLKVIGDIEQRRAVYRATKESDLYDAALKMFSISASLKGMDQSIGRMMAFSSGWLENQSIWLHMSYKFYLQLLRGGLYDEFFTEIMTGLVPFMDADVYGRSPLEAASFIVSSAFPDPKLHGASFLPRLSGSTAEFLSIWGLMMAGEAPFSLDKDGVLQLTLSPIIPGKFFTEDGYVKFTFLGVVSVVYYNPAKVDTWKLTPKKITVIGVDGTTEMVHDAALKGVIAQKVRSLQVESITVEYL